MAKSSRYFENKLPDYKGEAVEIDQPEWKAIILKMANECIEKQPVNQKNIDGGLYLGTAGIAYMYYHLSRNSAFVKEKETLLNVADKMIMETYELVKMRRSNDPTDLCSFILGDAGLHAVIAVIAHAKGDSKRAEEHLRCYNEVAEILKPVDCFTFGGDELFVGRAGYIAGALWLKSVFKQDVVPFQTIADLIISTLKSGKKNSQISGSVRSPLVYSYYNTRYLGAAHGLSSILQVLLSCPLSSELLPPDAADNVWDAVDYMLSLQYPSGNFPCAVEDIRGSTDSELVHWCHGAPGVVHLMAKAFVLKKDEKYLQSCIKCGDLTWERGLLRKGPGICHGVAGSGYVHLLLYRLTRDKKHYHRAVEFAKFIFSKEFKSARTPDHPYSLYEGTAGTVCFFADLFDPMSSSFPFLDVFYFHS